MSTLFEQVGGTSVAESKEFKIIALKIRENAHAKKVLIEKPSKEVKYELIRQGFNVIKYNYKTLYGCGCNDGWNQCRCYRCKYHKNKKLYEYYVTW